MYYEDIGGEYCGIYGGRCYDQGSCDSIFCEPSDHDVLNGWFDDDPEGLRKWTWKNKGCPKCNSRNVEIICHQKHYFTSYKCKDCNHEEEGY